MSFLRKLFHSKSSIKNKESSVITPSDNLNSTSDNTGDSLPKDISSDIANDISKTQTQVNRTPLWQCVPSNENREKDKIVTSDYSNVCIIFKNGEIQDVIPDVNNYYLATHYIINGIDYDISDIDSVNSIPLPQTKSPVARSSLGTLYIDWNICYAYMLVLQKKKITKNWPMPLCTKVP